ncbi:hypothetical protein ABLU18_01810 [Acinetobacter junii]|uniref:hypothetical protein n=1 Tax=Acinetobacter junii TaxID=40215 RepID=UPI0032B4D803
MNYKVEAWSWCADYCKKNQWNPHDSYFWNKANLEYRRQHNIFEVGDKVVLAQSYSLDTVHEIKRIENLTPHIKGSETTYFLENSLGCWLFQIKHATDEEIKAGKRLEVK